MPILSLISGGKNQGDFPRVWFHGKCEENILNRIGCGERLQTLQNKERHSRSKDRDVMASKPVENGLSPEQPLCFSCFSPFEPSLLLQQDEEDSVSLWRAQSTPHSHLYTPPGAWQSISGTHEEFKMSCWNEPSIKTALKDFTTSSSLMGIFRTGESTHTPHIHTDVHSHIEGGVLRKNLMTENIKWEGKNKPGNSYLPKLHMVEWPISVFFTTLHSSAWLSACK